MNIAKKIALGVVGLGLVGTIWEFFLSPQIEYNRKLRNLYESDSTVECTGTIWAAYKKYAPEWARWEDYKNLVVKLNDIKNEDFPKQPFETPIEIKDKGKK